MFRRNRIGLSSATAMRGPRRWRQPAGLFLGGLGAGAVSGAFLMTSDGTNFGEDVSGSCSLFVSKLRQHYDTSSTTTIAHCTAVPISDAEQADAGHKQAIAHNSGSTITEVSTIILPLLPSPAQNRVANAVGNAVLDIVALPKEEKASVVEVVGGALAPQATPVPQVSPAAVVVAAVVPIVASSVEATDEDITNTIANVQKTIIITSNAKREYTHIRYIPAAARRHLVRVYKLLMSGIAFAGAGFAFMLIGPSVVLGTVASAVAIPSVAFLPSGFVLPIWAPFAGVFAGMFGLALTSYIQPNSSGSGEAAAHNQSSTDREESNEEQPTARALVASASDGAVSMRTLAAIRRGIFYGISFAEGMTLAPLAQSLLMTNVLLAGFMVSFAVITGFAAVALYRGSYGLGLERAVSSVESTKSSSSQDSDEAHLQESTTVVPPKEDTIEYRRSPFYPNTNIIARNGTRGVEGSSLRLFEELPLLRESSYLIEGSLYGTLCGIVGYILASNVLFSTSAAAAGGALGTLGLSPITVGLLAASVSVAVAADSQSLLERYDDDGENTKGSRTPSIHSFFIVDDATELENSSPSVDVVSIAIDYWVALTGTCLRLVEMVMEADWLGARSDSLSVMTNPSVY